ncbi:MAG: SDR family oxidoreductase [Gammaproteobacteria bacterium]
MILITGASGKTGSEVARQLAAADIPFSAMVRSREKGEAFEEMGADIVVGDLSDEDFLQRALAGIEKAVLIMPNGEQQQAMETRFIDLAVAAGVEQLVYLSSIESVPENLNPITQMHVAVEKHLRQSGINWTIIRPSFFMQMFLGSAKGIRERGELVFPGGNGTVATTDLRDVGEVIRLVLTEPGHENKSYDLTGPELLTFDECAERISRVIGRDVRYVDQPMAEFADRLRSINMSDWRTEAVCKEFEAISRGIIDHTTDTVAELLNRPPVSLEQCIADHLHLFRD